MKKVLIVLLVILLAGGAYLYFNWQGIFQQSAEGLIMKNLPPYVKIDRVIFNFKENELEVKNFRILNPQGFKNKYLAVIDRIVCKIALQGKNILDGIEVTDITAQNPVIYIDRMKGGKINVNEMGEFMESSPSPIESAPRVPQKKETRKEKFKISDIVKLTETIDLNNGRVEFYDEVVLSPYYAITFDKVNAKLNLKLNDDYTGALSVGSTGNGYVNGDLSQKVGWSINMDPTKPELEMSSRFEPNNVDLTLFRPYYYKYSPIYIKSGRFSGVLIYNFDNGNIGASNTINIRNLEFEQKETSESAGFWQVPVAQLIEYLKTSPNEITFDFTIKGSMNNPSFNVGPITRKAIQSMAVDTITDLAESFTKKGSGEGAGAAAEGQSDAEKAINMIKGFLNQ